MKRWLSHIAIVAYLGALSWGIVAHTFQVGVSAHPVMYFLVWDMFCGWGAYATDLHIIGEGESGRFYEVAPGPWGELKPYGGPHRHNFDTLGYFATRAAQNNLRHTRHEPLTRIYVIEESWPKKFDLPDELWALRYEEPKDVQPYFHLRQVLGPDGNLLENHPAWINRLAMLSVSDNPRLHREVRQARPFYTVSPHEGWKQTHLREDPLDILEAASPGTMLGN